MAFKHKYTFEEKERIVTEYLNNTNGFRELYLSFRQRVSIYELY